MHGIVRTAYSATVYPVTMPCYQRSSQWHCQWLVAVMMAVVLPSHHPTLWLGSGVTTATAAASEVPHASASYDNLCESIIQHAQAAARAHNAHGDMAAAQREMNKAEEAYRVAASLQPDEPQAHFNWATVRYLSLCAVANTVSWPLAFSFSLSL